MAAGNLSSANIQLTEDAKARISAINTEGAGVQFGLKRFQVRITAEDVTANDTENIPWKARARPSGFDLEFQLTLVGQVDVAPHGTPSGGFAPGVPQVLGFSIGALVYVWLYPKGIALAPYAAPCRVMDFNRGGEILQAQEMEVTLRQDGQGVFATLFGPSMPGN